MTAPIGSSTSVKPFETAARGGAVGGRMDEDLAPLVRPNSGPKGIPDAERLESSTLMAVWELSKPRITRLVALTAAVGFGLNSIGRSADWTTWLVAGAGCLLGTALSSAGANALNQCMEIPRDARMLRTMNRPLPSGQLTLRGATIAGLAAGVAGLAVLWAACGLPSMLVSLVTMATYLLIYTPLKPVTVLNTWIGAVPGALPPLIGWAAAGSVGTTSAEGTWGSLTQPGGWSLFALMYVWQIPHFLAIAWMHRDDYARGGYRMLPIMDTGGRLTACMVVAWAVLLVPASLLPWWAMDDRLTWAYAGVALLSGLIFAGGAASLLWNQTRARARRVFIASIIHLPLLLLALVVDAGVAAWR